MSSAAKAHEPSMEEILASIRRIISDDEPGAGKSAMQSAAPQKPAPLPAAEAVAPSDPELGQDDIDAMFAAMDDAQVTAKAEAAPRVAPPPVPPVELQNDLDVLELTDEIEEPAQRPAATPAPEPARRAPPLPAAAEALLSAQTNEAVSNAFGSLANTIFAGNSRTIDDIVREMLRPMLRTWLDDNLPPLVERLVRAEIERVARGGR